MGKEISALIEKYKQQKIQIEKEYGQLIASHENLVNGCCALADVRARVDCVQQFYKTERKTNPSFLRGWDVSEPIYTYIL